MALGSFFIVRGCVRELVRDSIRSYARTETRIMKYRATINIDKAIWDKFREKCEAANTTATAELTAFMELINDDREYDYDRLNNDWDSMPETVKTLTDFMYGKIDLSMEISLDYRIKKMKEALVLDFAQLEQKVLSTLSSTTEDTDSGTTEDTDSGTTEDTDSITTEDTDSITDNGTTEDTDKFEHIQIGDKTITDAKQINNISKFQRRKTSDNFRTFNDTDVAKRIDKSRQTITRYRLGQRAPKEDFYQTWGLNQDGSGWVKL